MRCVTPSPHGYEEAVCRPTNAGPSNSHGENHGSGRAEGPMARRPRALPWSPNGRGARSPHRPGLPPADPAGSQEFNSRGRERRPRSKSPLAALPVLAPPVPACAFPGWCTLCWLQVHSDAARDRQQSEVSHAIWQPHDCRHALEVFDVLSRHDGTDAASTKRQHERPDGGKAGSVKRCLGARTGVLDPTFTTRQNRNSSVLQISDEIERLN